MKSKIIFNVRFVLLALALSLSLCISGFAQEVTGTIVGTVRDSTGATVSGATVSITDTAKDVLVRTVITNGDGEFSLPLLQSSIYSIAVEAANFKKSLKNNIKVDVGQRRTVDIILEAGKINETVTVEADAVAIDQTSATNGTVISGDQAREIPINNRNFVQLITLAPGVSNDLADQVYVGTTNPDGQANTVNISVNGARSSQNTFTVDGADVTDRGSNLTIQAYPSVDSIGEFKVLRSLYPAESGRSGGGQINVVTRSGGKKFSGSAFVFARNDAFNANNFLTNSITGAPPFGRDVDGKAKRAPFRYYNYGWTIGGPVSFFNFGEKNPSEPVFKKYDRTFFFFSQELRRDRRFTAPANTTVPDSSLLDGRFPIYVCVNRLYLAETCTGANVIGPTTAPISAGQINPAALGYLNGVYRKLPLPNNRTATNPYGLTAQIANEADFRQEIFKLDHSVNDKLSMYYRYQQDKIPTLDGNALFSSGSSLPGVSTTRTNSPGRTHTYQATYVASPKFIIEGRYNYGYGAILSENVGTLALTNTNVPITLPYVNQRDRVPTLSGNGFTGLTSFGPYDNFSYKHNFGGSVTYLTGNHSFKAGGTYSIYRKNENALSGNNEGNFSAFGITLPAAAAIPGGNTQPTSYTLPNGIVVPVTAVLSQNLQRWANFLVGNATAFSQARFDYTADLRQKTIEGFAQDEWKIASNMTLSLGVRYSFFGAPWDKNGRLSNFLPELFRANQAPLVTGAGTRVVDPAKNFCSGLIVNSQNFATAPNNCTPTISPFGKYVIDVSKKDFAPRIGLAWDPFKKGKTSVRMGYGIYHEQVLNGTFLQNIGTNPPYQETAIAATTRLDNPALNSGISLTTTSQSLRAVQSDWKTPYIQHWSLDWQQQLTSKTVVTIGYYGSKAVHLQGLTELNSIEPGKALRSQCAPGNNFFGQAVAFTSVPCQLPGYAFRGQANTAIQGNTNIVGTTLFTDTLILDQLRPYQGYRSIAIVQPRYNSNYHSLQLSATHRFTGSSQVNAFYTWSKNLTDSINDRTTSPQNGYDIRSEYQLAAFDRRHILSINYVYELPFFKTQQGFVGKVLGGWQVSGIATYNTGLPFTATTSALDPAGLGIINTNPAARPNLLCNPNSGGAGTSQQFFNTACFQTNPNLTVTDPVTGVVTRIPVSNTVGNTARGNITGPKTTRFDITLVKNLRFGEKIRIQFRAEAFNVLNKVNFRALSTNVTAANFGQVITVRDPRTMQFGAKFSF
jgi:Carboxypeptidase regulatory-like domain